MKDNFKNYKKDRRCILDKFSFLTPTCTLDPTETVRNQKSPIASRPPPPRRVRKRQQFKGPGTRDIIKFLTKLGLCV
jgi:hypothetical protein